MLNVNHFSITVQLYRRHRKYHSRRVSKKIDRTYSAKISAIQINFKNSNVRYILKVEFVASWTLDYVTSRS